MRATNTAIHLVVSLLVCPIGNSRRKEAWLGISIHSHLIETVSLDISWQISAGCFMGTKSPKRICLTNMQDTRLG
jgi:hypothetical protein